MYFLLACNIGEILIVFGAMIVGMPLPLRPVQLLWLNLVSDGAPALALGLEKGDSDIMSKPPRSPREPVIDRDMALGIAIVGIVDAIAILAVFFIALQRYPGHLEAAQTIAFVTLCSSELLRAFTARSEYHSVFSIGVFSNRWMVWAVAASFALVMVVVYVPFLQPFFDTVPLGTHDWLLMLPFFFASPVAMELLKMYFRGRPSRESAKARGLSPALVDLRGKPGRPGLHRGARAVQRVLVPVDGSRNTEFVLKRVVRQFMNNTAIEIHLLNVQPRFNGYLGRFLSRKDWNSYWKAEAQKAVGPSILMLNSFGIPHSVHTAIGERAKCITDAAHRLHCDHILMGTARKNSLTRLVENSVTNKVLQLTDVPVEVVAGDAVSAWERYGIPAAIAAVLALLFAAAD